MNFNPNDPYIQNMMKNMDASTMKNMFKNIDSMSDDQLKSMLSMTGRGDMDVTQFRNMSKNMANASDQDLNRMKNMNLNRPDYTQPNSNFANSTQPPIHKSNSTSIDDSFINKSLNKKSDRISLLESLKQEGNEFFRQKKYRESKEKYYELLNKAEMYNITKDSKEEKEIEEITMTVRLNISNCLINLEEYELAIHESNKSLKLKETFKGYYRLGTAYFMKKNYENAKTAFLKAQDLAKGDETKTVKDYLDKVGGLISKENSSNEPVEQQRTKAQAKPTNEEINEPPSVKKENAQKSTVSRILEKEKIQQSKLSEEDNIIIEIEDPKPIKSNHSNSSSLPNKGSFSNIDLNKMEEAKRTVENMVSQLYIY